MRRLPKWILGVFATAACTSQTDEHMDVASGAAPLIQISLLHDGPGPDRAVVVGDGDTLYVEASALVTDRDLQDARPLLRRNHLLIELHFTPDGLKRLEQITSTNIGRCLAFLVGGHVCGTPVIRSALGGPSPHTVVARCDAPPSEADRLAGLVRARWPGTDAEGRD